MGLRLAWLKQINEGYVGYSTDCESRLCAAQASSRKQRHDDITVLVVKLTMKDLRHTTLMAPVSL